jgi:hypothetical protein
LIDNLKFKINIFNDFNLSLGVKIKRAGLQTAAQIKLLHRFSLNLCVIRTNIKKHEIA